MKKILLSLLTLCVGLTAYAQTEYKFDDASAWGNYTNSKAGEFTQVNSGEVLTNGNIKIAVTFPESKNGVRFFANSTTGVINLRIYVESEITISTVDGSAFTTVELAGTNLGDKYLTGDGYENGTWKGNASSFTLKCIKSTVQIDKMTVYSGGNAPKDISNTPETAYTTSEAYTLIDAEEGLNTSVYVKGTVSRIDEKSDPATYGTLIYYITDGTQELEVYGGLGLGGEKFATVDDLQDGDEVIVYGQLVNYKGTYEFTSGNKLYSLNGKIYEGTVDPDPIPGDDPTTDYTLVGAGTLENPYTTEDIIKGVFKDGESIKDVWVKGTILGCVNTNKGNALSDKVVASNIALGNADGTSIIPVQLIAVDQVPTPTRAAVNVLDTPDNVGKTVYLFGNIEKYCSVAGMKSTSDFSWDGKTTSIKSVNSSSDASVIFNLNGQKLIAPQKGINIINGVKVLVK